MTHSNFVHLHLHTQYSLLDGAIKLDELFKRAREFRMPAVAITDHGNMFGAVDFYQQALKSGIKPILGCETYVAPADRREKDSPASYAGTSHLILLAMNQKGYKNLLKLVSAAYLEGFYYKPRVDRALLEEHNDGLIALSSCLRGIIAHLLQNGEKQRAFEAAEWYARVFQDRFYIEVQRTGAPEQEEVNQELLRIARELNLPVVATNDCHYLVREHAKAHDALLAIQTRSLLTDPGRFKFSGDQGYFKSPEEMETLFADMPDVVHRSVEIAERCNVELDLGRLHFPHIDVPEGHTLDSWLADSARRGLAERLPEIDAGKHEAYRARLEEEIGIIRNCGYAGYFLIVADFIRYAKERQIPVGPGRGSAAGSLVAWSLGITDIDPIRYDLFFERFLNPERVSPPDIDVDFCVDRRDEVIRYVQEKYGGAQNVAQIITFGKMQAKAVIRDVGRVMNLPYGEVDRIAKLVPNTLNITLDESVAASPQLRELEENDSTVGDLLATARILEGLTRHASTHAAGVVISNSPLVDHLPLYKDNKDNVVTQFDMKSVEKIGLIKFDFLGLTTLTLIERAVRLIRELPGHEDFDIARLPLDDPKVFRLLSEGDTPGVFQLESRGMTELLIKLRPESFEEIIALVALYRPGPLESGMVDDFIKRKHKKVAVVYELPQLEPILRDTYGTIVYQEQVMQIAARLAGFTLAEADLLRRAMGKKIAAEMDRQRERFLEGAKHQKIDPRKAAKVFDQMAKFAKYGFNKSHSAAYALIAYQTAYLKAHFPVQFMAALLTSEQGNADKVMRYIGECREQGIEVLPPDVNASQRDFTVIERKIRFGLGAVKNVGEGAVQSIIAAREEPEVPPQVPSEARADSENETRAEKSPIVGGGHFESLEDFARRVDHGRVNRRVVESLIKCGAFDAIARARGTTRAGLMGGLDQALESAQKAQRDRASGQFSLFGAGAIAAPPAPAEPAPEWPENVLLAHEKESLGFYITGHPLAQHADLLRRFADVRTPDLAECATGREVKIGGVVAALREVRTKKGQLMGFVTLEDLEGMVEVVVFSDVYAASSPLLKSERPILVIGTVEHDGEASKLIAREIFPLTEVRERLGVPFHFRLTAPGLSAEHFEKLKTILAAHRGPCPAVLHLILPNHSETVIALPEALRVKPTPDLEDALEHQLGALAAIDDGEEPAAGAEVAGRDTALAEEPSEDLFESEADDDPGQDLAPLQA